MALTYATWKTTIANLLAVEEANTDFVQILPSMIDYAQNRIENDLDLIATHAAANVLLAAGTRTATLPTPSVTDAGPIYIPESASVISPSATVPDSGTRNPLQRVSLEYLNYSWPTVTESGLPVCFALQNDTTMVLGPAPDAPYYVEVVGVYSPPVLSSTTTTTWITTNIPELFVAASAVFGFGWQRDTASASSDPAAPIFWEQRYEELLRADTVQEMRKRSWSSGWTAMNPTPLANPPRV